MFSEDFDLESTVQDGRGKPAFSGFADHNY